MTTHHSWGSIYILSKVANYISYQINTNLQQYAKCSSSHERFYHRNNGGNQPWGEVCRTIQPQTKEEICPDHNGQRGNYQSTL